MTCKGNLSDTLRLEDQAAQAIGGEFVSKIDSRKYCAIAATGPAQQLRRAAYEAYDSTGLSYGFSIRGSTERLCAAMFLAGRKEPPSVGPPLQSGAPAACSKSLVAPAAARAGKASAPVGSVAPAP